MIHLETGGQPSDAHPVWRMTMAYDDDLYGDDENTAGREKTATPYGPYA